MRLRAIELHGYKSFAARTSLQFDSSMTAIVGPNGSGKSNVMDGLRWAIGAGTGRALRTRRAEDVVFSGGRDRAPSGFAEVRIQLDNSQHWLELDAAEVELVRRVHRDGQSETRINGRAARLRDVQDLFRNSGLGAGGFALMSQGLVDEMLRLRPLERRQAIEEVGGVRQHRHQMEESRRRRERAQEHLERARLLRDELAPRLKSLERASRRAQQLDRVKLQLEEAQRSYFRSAESEMQQDLHVRREAALSAEAARDLAEQDRADATSALASIERETAVARQTAESAAERIRTARAELRTLEHQQELDQQQRSWLAREVADRSSRLASQRAELSAIDVAAASDELVRANAKLSEARAERDRTERTRAETSTRHRRAHAEVDEIAASAVRLSRRWRASAAQLQLLASGLSAAENDANNSECAARDAEQSLQSAEQGLSSELEAERRDRQQRTILAERLRELDTQMAAIENRVAQADTLRARVYQLTDDYARADAIFGELMDATLHDSTEDAVEAVRRVVEADAGRATALDLERSDHLIRSLIDAVRFVDDEAAAIRSAAEGRTAVTPDGIVVRADGVVLGGGSLPGASRLRRQLAELRSEREQVSQEIASLPALEEIASRVAEANRLCEQARTAHEASRRFASEARLALETVRRRRAAALNELSLARKESTTLRVRLSDARALEARAASDLQAQTTSAQVDISSLEQRRDECAAVLAEARAQAASVDRARADRARLASLRRELEQVDSAIREREPLLAQASTIASDTAAQDVAQEHLDVLDQRRDQAGQALERTQQARLSRERQLVETEAALREVEAARARLAAEAAAEGIELAVILSVPPARAAVQQNLDLSTAEHSANGSANGTGLPLLSSTPASAVAVAERESVSVAELREQVLSLRARMQRIGPVDPGAASEYESEQARWKSIETQIADLEQTETSLREAERELEQQIDRQFRDACRRVDEAFQRYFQLMFRGGSAELVLTEEAASLAEDEEMQSLRPQQGVDIRAQPPGKRVSSLGLLSGGERALTAIALLFALLEVRPAPFCILDEVDAALDEANVERFVNALKERARHTQFVIITHNRRTIEQADSIYGVTMGAAGVSRLLSVRVDQLPQAQT